MEKQTGSKGLPKGVTNHLSGKFQARVYVDRYGRGIKKQEFIPGLFDTAEGAQAAQADALLKLANEGPLAVWPHDADHKAERNKRGQVCLHATLAHRLTV